MKRTKLIAALTAALLVVAVAPVAAEEGHTATDRTIKNPHDGTEIAITVFKPKGATASDQVPVVLHSHGWGGSRETEIAGTVKGLLDAGFGVVSIDQRGHGDSGGQATVQDPTKETEDIKSVIDYVASLDWVRHDRDASGNVIADDPVLGAIGGSYGGGYQTMTAFDEIADEGRTRFNALAPQITWYDLPESLAPQKVVRSTWNTLLYAAGASMVPQYIHEAFIWGSTTGQWPDGTLYGEKVAAAPDLDSVFHKHSPVWFVERGYRIDVPMLLRQGTTDNLFPLNEGLKIFDKALSDEAREDSYFVAFNGGHALPNAVPAGSPAAFELGGGVDACSGNFDKLTIEFFKRVFNGGSTDGLLPSRYNLTDLTGEKCLHLGNLKKAQQLELHLANQSSIPAPVGAGAPLQIPIAQGPLTVTGVPKLSGVVTNTTLDARSFFGLAVGTTPVDARVIQNNLLPLRVIRPVVDKEFSIELPGVAVDIPKGQSLYLTVSPVSDMYYGHASRTPGAMLLGDLELTLPGSKAKKAKKQ